jgi:hypothetical protein
MALSYISMPSPVMHEVGISGIFLSHHHHDNGHSFSNVNSVQVVYHAHSHDDYHDTQDSDHQDCDSHMHSHSCFSVHTLHDEDRLTVFSSVSKCSELCWLSALFPNDFYNSFLRPPIV